MEVKPKVIIFAAPSGSGKTTIVKHVLETNPNIEFSISATTREKRVNEIDGEDYHFLSIDDFKSNIKDDNFIEHEEVYDGLFYGTLKSEIKKLADAGKTIIFDLDVQGGISIKNYFGDDAISIVIKPPSIQTLKDRLRKRGTETEENIMKRISKAKSELTFCDQYDKVLLNNVLVDSFKEAQSIIDNFLID